MKNLPFYYLHICRMLYIYIINNDKMYNTMKTQTTISKSKVMKAAWTIFRKMDRTMENWSKALIRAWAWAKKTFGQVQGISGYNVIRETEKAICVSATLVCYITDQASRNNVWVPKSIIKGGVIPSWFASKKEEEAKSLHGYYGNGGSSLQLVWN